MVEGFGWVRGGGCGGLCGKAARSGEKADDIGGTTIF